MVGVVGKYQGCETCRRRRAKCSNERPFCRKCLDSGRTCEGYGRERVFIVGTPDEAGRCSSHPRRVTKSANRRGGKSPFPESSASDTGGSHTTTPQPVAPRISVPARSSTLFLQPVLPLLSAWDDFTILSDADGLFHRVQIAALRARILSADADATLTGAIQQVTLDNNTFRLTLGPDDGADPRMTDQLGLLMMPWQCLFHTSPAEDEAGRSLDTTGNILLFLYQHKSSDDSLGLTSQQTSAIQPLDFDQSSSPDLFQTFPAHYVFARIYRPRKIYTACRLRTPTSLAGEEWLTVPWTNYQKTSMDNLLDMMAQVPALLERLDNVSMLAASSTRRLVAQELLKDCMILQSSVDRWHATLISTSTGQESLFWPLDDDDSDAQIPFGARYAFRDYITSIQFVFLWTINIIFHPCVEQTYIAICEPVSEGLSLQAYTSGVHPSQLQILPTHHHYTRGQLHRQQQQQESLLPTASHQFDPTRYQMSQISESAANMCRSLDYALELTTQPDLLAIPLEALEHFYGMTSLGGGSMDGGTLLERLWLEGFRERLQLKWQYMANVVQEKTWTTVAEAG